MEEEGYSSNAICSPLPGMAYRMKVWHSTKADTYVEKQSQRSISITPVPSPWTVKE
jgi:hypothetical protein